MYDRDALLSAVDLAQLADDLLGPRSGSARTPMWRCPNPGHAQTGRTPPLSVFASHRGEQRWDFDDEIVTVPGRPPLVAYLRVHPCVDGSRVEVDQLAENPQRLAFLADVWSTVLGRFAQHHAAATVHRGRRTSRPKRYH